MGGWMMHSLDLGRYSRQNHLGGQAMVEVRWQVRQCRELGAAVPYRAGASCSQGSVRDSLAWGGLAGTSKGPAALAGWLAGLTGVASVK